MTKRVFSACSAVSALIVVCVFGWSVGAQPWLTIFGDDLLYLQPPSGETSGSPSANAASGPAEFITYRIRLR